MCTRKVEIKLKRLSDMNNIWKMPYQLSSTYIKGGIPHMMSKCGKCYECKKERARNWTYKIWLEAKEHKEKCFITLTYADHEYGKNLNKEHLQNFIKRLRKNENAKIKYFAAGEYGENKGRAHYHIIILGWQPKDMKKMHGAKSGKGKELWNSKTIKDLWGYGRITVQPFAKNEVGYLSLYIGHNEELDETINKETKEKRKKEMFKLQLKYGIITKYYDVISQKWQFMKTTNIKDLDKEIYKEYKKEYNEKILKIKDKKQKEFNIYSKGMGFKTYIEREYYKIDLLIENNKLERPKEYLRKIYENPINEEIEMYNTKELLERKKYAEENFIDINNIEHKRSERLKEETQFNDNENNKKLNKHVKSIF